MTPRVQTAEFIQDHHRYLLHPDRHTHGTCTRTNGPLSHPVDLIHPSTPADHLQGSSNLPSTMTNLLQPGLRTSGAPQTPISEDTSHQIRLKIYILHQHHISPTSGQTAPSDKTTPLQTDPGRRTTKATRTEPEAPQQQHLMKNRCRD